MATTRRHDEDPGAARNCNTTLEGQAASTLMALTVHWSAWQTAHRALFSCVGGTKSDATLEWRLTCVKTARLHSDFPRCTVVSLSTTCVNHHCLTPVLTCTQCNLVTLGRRLPLQLAAVGNKSLMWSYHITRTSGCSTPKVDNQHSLG